VDLTEGLFKSDQLVSSFICQLAKLVALLELDWLSERMCHSDNAFTLVIVPHVSLQVVV
jgi:hypothetical protein